MIRLETECWLQEEGPSRLSSRNVNGNDKIRRARRQSCSTHSNPAQSGACFLLRYATKRHYPSQVNRLSPFSLISLLPFLFS